MKIAIIGGTGSQGLNLGKRFAIAGEDVIIGSRKEEKALMKVEETLEELKDYENISMVGMANEVAGEEGEILI